MGARHSNEKRAEFAAAREQSGASVSAIASKLGIGLASAYKWEQQRRAAERAAVAAAKPALFAPRFAEVIPLSPRDDGSGLHVKVGSASIRVCPGFDHKLLRAVVIALTEEDTP